VLLAPVLFGCQAKTKNHQEWVNSAEGRWNDLRSAQMLEMAQQRFETGDLDLAEKTLVEALAYDPGNARLHLLAGRIALERGQLERSYHLFDSAVTLDEKLTEAYSYRGLVLQRWQRWDQAYASYSQAYELEKDNVAYLLAMSEMLICLDRTDEAIALLEGKKEYFDQNAPLRAALGHMYGMKQEHARAVDYFREAALLDPDNSKMTEELALAQLAAGQWARAAQTLSVLLKDSSMQDRRDLQRALASAYVRAGRADEAREIYLKIARASGGDADDWIKLGELSLRENDRFGALYAANQAINIAPMRHEGYLLAGMIAQQDNKLDDALRMFDRAAELAPDSAVPLILRGISLEKAGRRTAAAEAYTQALQRKPQDTRAQRLLQGVASAAQ
jgi:tetratricopeptide (TPR) repeat protein